MPLPYATPKSPLSLLIMINFPNVIGSEKTQNLIDIREGCYFHINVPNQLPEESDLPGFAETVTNYMEQITQLG